MGRVVVVNWISLDGVMQGPGRADEDTRDGFADGGWATPYSDEVVGAKLGERLSGDHAWLFGRRSYEDMLAAWNERGGPFKDSLNARHKYVASRDASTRLRWPSSSLLTGNVPAAVTELAQAPRDLIIMGSGVLIDALSAAGAIDEYLLMIAPLVLGAGRRLFSGGGRIPLRLVESTPATTGAIVASYVPVDRVT